MSKQSNINEINEKLISIQDQLIKEQDFVIKAQEEQIQILTLMIKLSHNAQEKA